MAVAKVFLTTAALCLLNACAQDPLYFTATLAADPAAVQPVIPSSLSSRAHANLILWPNNDMQLSIDWDLANISSTNKVIGIHIHDGDHSENGGILYGFCGQSPLPEFGVPSGPCAQKPKGSFVYIGSPCALGKGSPCVTTSSETGVSTAASAAVYLREHLPFRKNFYINLHTTLSFDSTETDNMRSTSKALGLIRGQLVEASPVHLMANLAADPAAVQPVIPSSLSSRAHANLVLWPNDAMQLSIDWDLDNISSTNKVIGIHIHDGDHSENGGILYGFCGQSPLPAFGVPSGPCAQTPKGSFVYIGSPCALGKGSPCVTTSGETGVSTAASAAAYLRERLPFRKNFYINLHTDLSFDSTEVDNMSNTSKAWGLIRGQLVGHEVSGSAAPFVSLCVLLIGFLVA